MISALNSGLYLILFAWLWNWCARMCHAESLTVLCTIPHGNVVNDTDLFSVGWLGAQGQNSPSINIYFRRKLSILHLLMAHLRLTVCLCGLSDFLDEQPRAHIVKFTQTHTHTHTYTYINTHGNKVHDISTEYAKKPISSQPRTIWVNLKY